MTNPVTPVTQDTTPPSAPSGLSAPVSGSTVSLGWTASTDNVGVSRYNVHRSTTSGFTPGVANRVGQPSGTSYADSGLAAGTYYYRVIAEDAAGNLSAASSQVSATVTAVDTTPPSAPSGLSAPVSGSTVSLGWTASTDNVGVSRYNVHRSTTSGFTPGVANRVGAAVGDELCGLGSGGGHLLLPGDRRGRGGQPRAPLRTRRARR